MDQSQKIIYVYNDVQPLGWALETSFNSSISHKKHKTPAYIISEQMRTETNKAASTLTYKRKTKQKEKAHQRSCTD